MSAEIRVNDVEGAEVTSEAHVVSSSWRLGAAHRSHYIHTGDRCNQKTKAGCSFLRAGYLAGVTKPKADPRPPASRGQGRRKLPNPRSIQHQVRLDEAEDAALLTIRERLGTTAHPRTPADAFRWLLDGYSTGKLVETPISTSGTARFAPEVPMGMNRIEYDEEEAARRQRRG